LILGGVPREATLLQQSAPQLPKRARRPPHARRHLPLPSRDQDDKTNDGEPKNVMMCAFGAPLRHQAGGRGGQGRRHLLVGRDRMGGGDALPGRPRSHGRRRRARSKLDPTSDNGISAKMGLDATAPVSAPELAFKRIRVKGEEEVALGR